MLEQLAANPVWFWLSLGGLLLVAEMLGAGFYLLWSGIAAVIVGVLAWLLPLSWQWQSFLFALLVTSIAYLWWRWQTKHRLTPPVINQRGQQLIGLRATLTEATQDGYSRIKVGDSSWRIWSDIELAIGTEVTVVAIDGITLKVKPTGVNSSTI